MKTLIFHEFLKREGIISQMLSLVLIIFIILSASDAFGQHTKNEQPVKITTTVKNESKVIKNASAKSTWVYWQATGGGFVPTDETIKNQDYWTVTKAGRVKYKGDGTKPLVFSCPVTSFNPNVNSGDGTILRLFYQDPDGRGEDFKVQARLMSFSKSNGALNEVCKVVSDKQGQWQESSKTCNNLDMDANLYWVEVIISRTEPSNLVVELNGVSLEGAIF